MKIVCDACGAKYSIADDKVKGKVFKIRCKKCSNIIVVRGNAGGGAGVAGGDDVTTGVGAGGYDAQKETRVFDYQGYDDAGAAAAAQAADEPAWHVVIDQEQVGPLSVAEVYERFNAGQLDGESYIWREGFADWQPLNAVDAFAGIFAGAAAGGGGAEAVASMFGGAPAAEEHATGRSDPADLFSSAGMSAPAIAVAGGDDDGELFGSRGSKSSAPAAASSSGTSAGTG